MNNKKIMSKVIASSLVLALGTINAVPVFAYSKDETVYTKANANGSSYQTIVSASCFFAATCGVSIISKIDMIGSICTLISRGALISMVVVITMLPAFLMVFDKIICKTTKRTRHADIKY